jgi:hypothetical protein
MSANRATIYSNGIADFQRIFQIKAGAANKISIPVRQQHLGDVLASLTISGDVEIVSPPSYQPANLDDSNISLATENVMLDLATQLAGADVEIKSGNATTCGRLVGLHAQEASSAGEAVTEHSMVVLTDKGLSRIPVAQIENLNFVDETIQAEIEKALSRRLRDIKPNSTFVDLQLKSDDGEKTAVVQYTIPAAAWKISYRILINADGPIEFHGHAIVDNNTDEDWKEFYIAVVMGQPISFTTDLADSKTPSRSHVNVVQDSALGAVEVEESVDQFAFGAPAPMMAMGDSDESASKSSRKKAKRSMRMSGAVPSRGGSARSESADVTETGDFCIFESRSPVSIDANRSAVIPVFATTLDKSKPVLHFKIDNHPERPFRTLRFKNTTEHSLGRGVCTIYDGTTYAGSCILPATKPDGDALLPHALETSVRVSPKNNPTKNRRIGIRISEGVAYESFHQTAVTEYVIQNRRDASFDFLLDHRSRLLDEKYEIDFLPENGEGKKLVGEELKSGQRIEFVVEPKQNVKIVVTETSTRKSRIVLATQELNVGRLNVTWLYDNIVESNSSLADEPAVRECIDLKASIDAVGRDIAAVESESKRLATRQQRLRENIKTGSADQLTAKWQSDLASCEDKLVELEDERMPALHEKLSELNQSLHEKLRSLAIEWNE